MAKFKIQIDVEPEDIPSLDDAHKHDCANALINTINSVLKYTVIFSIAAAGFFGVYSIIVFWWGLRMQKMLPQISPIIPAVAIIMLAMEFLAGTMKRPALILQIIFHIVLLFASMIAVPTLIFIPFVFYGIIQHVKLITLVPLYDVISSQKGYPDFMPPLSRDILDSETLKKGGTEKVSETEAKETEDKKENIDDDSQTDSKSSVNNQ